MGVHLFVFVLLVIIALILGHQPSKQNPRLFLFISFGLLLFERSFVEPTSMPDLESYRDSFIELSGIDLLKPGQIAAYQFTHKEEIGSMLLMSFVSTFSNDYNVFLLIYGVIWLFLYSYVIVKYSNNIFLSFIILFLLICGQSLFVIRQHIAIPIILLSYDAVIRKKLFLFLALVILASLFHFTAIVSLPVYFIYRNRKTYKLIIASILFLIALILVVNRIDLVNSYMILDYSSYIQGHSDGGYNFPLYISIFFAISYVIILGKKAFQEGINKLVLILIIMDVILNSVSTTLTLVTRLALYFHIAIIFIVPLVTKSINNYLLKIMFVVFTVLILMYIQFYGSFFVNLQNMRLSSLTAERVIWYALAFLLFGVFYNKVLRPYLEHSAKMKKQLLNEIKIVKSNE